MGRKRRKEASPESVVAWLESSAGEGWRYENVEMVGSVIARIKPDNELHVFGAADCVICNSTWRSILERDRERELRYFRASWDPEAYPECA